MVSTYQGPFDRPEAVTAPDRWLQAPSDGRCQMVLICEETQTHTPHVSTRCNAFYLCLICGALKAQLEAAIQLPRAADYIVFKVIVLNASVFVGTRTEVSNCTLWAAMG